VEALRRLGDERVARFATIGANGPHIVPVVFAVDGGRLVTAVDQKPKQTRELQRLTNIAVHPRVSVLVDHYDEDWSQLWWVRVDGSARVVSSGPDFGEGIGLLVAKYEQYQVAPPLGPVIVVEIDRVVGWLASRER